MSRDLRDHPPLNLLDHNAILALLNDAVVDDDSGYFHIDRYRPDGTVAPINLGEDGEEIDEDHPEHVPTQAEINAKVAPETIRAFLGELERGTIMSLETGGMCSSLTTFGWVWHSRIGGGLLYNYCSDVPLGDTQLEVLEEKTSAHFSDRLTKLLLEQDYQPTNLVGMEVTLKLDGINADDLTDAVKRGVFAQEPSDPDPATSAADWVREHTAPKEKLKSKRRSPRQRPN